MTSKSTQPDISRYLVAIVVLMLTAIICLQQGWTLIGAALITLELVLLFFMGNNLAKEP